MDNSLIFSMYYKYRLWNFKATLKIHKKSNFDWNQLKLIHVFMLLIKFELIPIKIGFFMNF